MKTQHSFSFEARRYVPPHLERVNSIESDCSSSWIMSAGRWDSHIEAAKAAAAWLVANAEADVQQHEIRVVQVEELDLVE
jgi:hypothetical protein